MSVGGRTLGTGVTNAAFYIVGYLHCVMLLQIISCTTGASSS
jgi:hypothetical protein